jgi:hypothetical protein
MPSKEFKYEILFDEDDQDLFDKWTRPEDAVQIRRFAERVMHRIASKPSKNHTVDHINMNPFDNRRRNLRWATRDMQNANRRHQRNNKSGHVGITQYIKNKGKDCYWEARIRAKKAYISAKCFPFTEDGYVQSINWYHEQMIAVHGQKWECRTCKELSNSFKIKCST